VNNIRDLKPEGREDVVIYGYEEVAMKLPILRYRLTAKWDKINGPDHYYWVWDSRPSAHQYGLIKFNRRGR